MYSRQLADRVVEFGHEGLLYRDSFVMYDRKTDSLWVHTTGECVKGELKGRQLDFIPSTITSWGKWKARHPKSLVLEGKKAKGFMGTYSLTEERAKRFGFSVGQGEKARLYPVPALMKHRVIQDRFDGDDIVVFFDKQGMHATAWIRNGHSFSWNGKAIVDEKQRPWDVMLGRPVGAGNDEKMTPLVATAWLVTRWKGFYPDSKIWGEGEKK